MKYVEEHKGKDEKNEWLDKESDRKSYSTKKPHANSMTQKGNM